jgi:hypothetical protein
MLLGGHRCGTDVVPGESVVRGSAGWELGAAQPARPAACHARTTVDGALKLYVRDPSAPPLTWQGDHELADALAGVKAILG